MECKNDTHARHCNCSYEGCPKKGVCCDCIAYHRAKRQLPACVFPDVAERTYDRSFEHFAKLVASGSV